MNFMCLQLNVKKLLRFLLFFLLVANPHDSSGQDYYKIPKKEMGITLSKATYDFEGLANQITVDYADNLQKVAAIYKWICDSIAYDTSFRVRTADECIRTRRGVCQAYCEVFYQLAQAVGIKVEIINGLSKNSLGEVERRGHAWLFAYTSEDRGIIVDPTWGAGSVIDDVFVRSKNCWLWFNVDPEWLIFSHWPRDPSYQLQEQHMTERDFRNAPPVNELWLEYGLDAHELALKMRAGTLELPKFYNRGEGDLSIVDIPLCRSLKMGETYPFRIRVKPGRDFLLHNNRTRCTQEEWTLEADSSYSVRFMPKETGDLTLCLLDRSGQGWNGIISYEIEAPTSEDWQRVEEADPLSAPELKNIKNLHAAKWDSAGIDARHLLQLVREQQVQQLPILYTNKGQQLTIVSVPMNYRLKAGESYTFSFRPRSGIKWAMKNNDKMRTDWEIGDDNLHSMTIAPEPGILYLFVKMREGESYWSCMKYEVIP